jgi:hypothetical protein
MQALIAVLLLPFLLLNCAGSVVSGIWLGFLGEWKPIISGIVISAISQFILVFVLLPGTFLFAMPAMRLSVTRFSFLSYPIGLLNIAYIYAVVSVWCVSIWFYYVSESTTASSWPLLLWSYGIALGPWAYMANKESQSEGTRGIFSIMTTLNAQVAYIAMGTVFAFTVDGYFALKVFFIIMLAGLLFQAIIGFVVFLIERAASNGQ